MWGRSLRKCKWLLCAQNGVVIIPLRGNYTRTNPRRTVHGHSEGVRHIHICAADRHAQTVLDGNCTGPRAVQNGAMVMRRCLNHTSAARGSRGTCPPKFRKRNHKSHRADCAAESKRANRAAGDSHVSTAGTCAASVLRPYGVVRARRGMCVAARQYKAVW